MSLWNLFKHNHSESPYHQLWVLDGGFGWDEFTYYGSWAEDNSIIYRITTNTAWIAKWASTISPIKANTVFLKVQVSGHEESYELLQKHAPSAMVPPTDFKSGAKDKNWVTAAPLFKSFTHWL